MCRALPRVLKHRRGKAGTPIQDPGQMSSREAETAIMSPWVISQYFSRMRRIENHDFLLFSVIVLVIDKPPSSPSKANVSRQLPLNFTDQWPASSARNECKTVAGPRCDF
jgi:hypothetical protein